VARKGGLSSRFDVRCRNPVSVSLKSAGHTSEGRGANLATVKRYVQQQRVSAPTRAALDPA